MDAKTFKSSIAASLLVSAILAPLTAEAETTVFSGKDAYAHLYGFNGGLYLTAHMFERSSHGQSSNTESSGISIQGSYRSGKECWYGYGSSDAIQFQSTGPTPSVVASGSVVISWNEYCSLHTRFTETVTFNADLQAITDSKSSRWGMERNEYGNVKMSIRYDYVTAPATMSDGSYISSPKFGTVTNGLASIGQSKSHEVEISQ